MAVIKGITSCSSFVYLRVLCGSRFCVGPPPTASHQPQRTRRYTKEEHVHAFTNSPPPLRMVIRRHRAVRLRNNSASLRISGRGAFMAATGELIRLINYVD